MTWASRNDKGRAMYTCYDCDRFGNGCDGTIPSMEFRNALEKYCKRFILVAWRRDMFKDAGKSRLGD
jgi:hypothetical protein